MGISVWPITFSLIFYWHHGTCCTYPKRLHIGRQNILTTKLFENFSHFSLCTHFFYDDRFTILGLCIEIPQSGQYHSHHFDGFSRWIRRLDPGWIDVQCAELTGGLALWMKKQKKQNMTFHDICPYALGANTGPISALTLFIPKVMFKYGQIPPIVWPVLCKVEG